MGCTAFPIVTDVWLKVLRELISHITFKTLIFLTKGSIVSGRYRKFTYKTILSHTRALKMASTKCLLKLKEVEFISALSTYR